MEADRTFCYKLPLKGDPPREAGRAHACRRTDSFDRFFRVGDQKRTVFTAQETGCMESFEFLAFTQIKPLPNINESRHGRILWTQCPRDDRANMRRGRCLRRCISSVPLVLMSRMQNETEITGRVRSDQGGAIHHLCD